MDFDLSPRSEQWRERLQSFFDREVLPRHRAWVEHVAMKREAAPFMDDLQQKARAADCGISGFPNSHLTSRARDFQTWNTRRSPKSWGGCSGLQKSSIAR